MGTISARDCLRVLELTEQVAAALALAVLQGLRLRERQGEPALERLAPEARDFLESFAWLPFLDEDVALDGTLLSLVASIRNQAWSLYP